MPPNQPIPHSPIIRLLYITILWLFLQPHVSCDHGAPGRSRGGLFSRISRVNEKTSPSIANPSSPLIPNWTKLKLNRVPPIIFFLLSTNIEPANSSPLNPQPIRLSSPFFQGWLLRLTDHDKHFSLMFIIGSFSPRGRSEFTEHYVFCAASEHGNTIAHVEQFPSPETVTITGDPPSRPSISSLIPRFPHAPPVPLNITWTAQGLGKFTYTEKQCTAHFTFSDGCTLELKATKRVPWVPTSSTSPTPALSGPEGWLGYTTLLPCHYFVHTVGSVCTYVFSHHHYTLTGSGYAHIEGNHGTMFPIGWAWAQGIAPQNRASFSLVVGKFDIASLRPVNVVLYLRWKEDEHDDTNDRVEIFRTTDFDTIAHHLDSRNGCLNITAVHSSRRIKVQLDISAPPASFLSSAVYIPTAEGFSNTPGCKESYVANATARVYEYADGEWLLQRTLAFPLSCLEFGNSYNK